MNLEIFKQPDPSGRMSKESYLFKNHKDVYDYILEYCQINSIFDISFKEKVYLCLNNFKNIPTCQNPSCQKRVKFKNSTLGYLKYCSNKCISSDPNIKKIKEEKSLEKFGTKSPAQSDIIKEKIIKTNQEKWGGNSPMSSIDIQNKSKDTLLKNWGVDNPNKSEELLEKRVKSFKQNIEQYKKSYKKTSIEKYGVDHPWKNKEIHDKSVLESRKFRVSKTFDCVLNIIPNNYKINNVCNETSLIDITCDKGHNFTSTRAFIYDRFRYNSEICTECNPINSQKSGAEISLLKFIKEFYSGEIIENDRNIIKPFEVDIYLPELKLAIEYNGLWWHSSEYREYDYHSKKQSASTNSNIKLLTIWEDDWVDKSEIVKSLIIKEFNLTENKIESIECDIFEVNADESNNFLIKNSLYGKSKSSVRISLKLDQEIVSLMTFIRNKDGWELNRFCNRNFTRVVGGFSKIINYFVKKYSPKFVMTFSDNMQSDGSVYKENGFEMVEELAPSYTILMSKRRVHRLNNLDGQNLPKIYNAGNKKWILNFEK